MASAARKLCRQFGIRFNPIGQRCGELETWCRNTIEHLLKNHGEEAMVLTLRVLTETHRNNRSALNREVITAVN
ncbi:hypothetical protein [Bradyrhizobium sp. Tv2a-2]|uniref:hypothetical protein n=1 Tax=Bradyrhizobium sp. Tv2a-2 TaxID=113395 RepID=UPI0004015516|nr:hypothetical protein [Bradyrhizobium sp. Tv2a-2]